MKGYILHYVLYVIYYKGFNAKLDYKYKIFVTTPIKHTFHFHNFFQNHNRFLNPGVTTSSYDTSIYCIFTIQQLSRNANPTKWSNTLIIPFPTHFETFSHRG